MTTAAVDIEISYSSIEDVDVLATIPPAAMKPDLIGRALFSHPEDDTDAERWMKAEIEKSLQNPNCHVFKATIKGSGEIVGHAIVRFEDNNKSSEPTTEKTGPPSMPPFFNAEFARTLFGQLGAMREKYMGDRKCVAWGSLFIKPGHQRKGIGKAMLRWGFEKLELDKQEIWLTTQMPGRDFYRKFGWEDVDAVDMDFSTYLGSFRGFGIHRTMFMMRKPGALVESAVEIGVARGI